MISTNMQMEYEQVILVSRKEAKTRKVAKANCDFAIFFATLREIFLIP